MLICWWAVNGICDSLTKTTDYLHTDIRSPILSVSVLTWLLRAAIWVTRNEGWTTQSWITAVYKANARPFNKTCRHRRDTWLVRTVDEGVPVLFCITCHYLDAQVRLITVASNILWQIEVNLSELLASFAHEYRCNWAYDKYVVTSSMCWLITWIRL